MLYTSYIQMTKNYKNLTQQERDTLEMAVKYKFSYEELFHKLPEESKKQILSKDDNRMKNDFVKEVLKAAENF